MTPAVSVRGLSKQYRLGSGPRAQYRTLRESLGEVADATCARLRSFVRRDRTGPRQAETLWALDDVSFDVRQGETLAIIGCNGAGKSTLLKILSRITEPTKGRAELRGTFGSLLEVGTGFHPELTGRENIFLSGSILGMSRAAVRSRFDEIVDFAEIGPFIDTPLKRYSSGMYVRLAFSVSAHLDPDILVIDEVLAVGDLAFQRKCLEHVKRLRDFGGTVLLVSHNMFAVKATCTRGLFLSRGKLAYDGATEEAIGLYEKESHLATLAWAEDRIGKGPAGSAIQIKQIELLDDGGRPCTVFNRGERMRVRLTYEARQPIEDPNFIVAFIRIDGVACCNHASGLDGLCLPCAKEKGVLEVRTPPLKLVAESYRIHVLIRDRLFCRLYAAQEGPSFHVRDELLSTHFGVYHEPADWSYIDHVAKVQVG
jgi:lipopolysaccharide transport system ATP-binding protein